MSEDEKQEERRRTGFFDSYGRELHEGDLFYCNMAVICKVIDFEGEWCYECYHAGAIALADETKDWIILLGSSEEYPDHDIYEQKLGEKKK